MEDKELDEFFGPEETESANEEVEQEVETEGDQETDDSGEDAADKEASTAEDKEPESEIPDEHAPQTIPMAAYMEEKRKRQEYEKEVNSLRELLPKKGNDDAPDPYEDLDAYNEFQRKKWESEQIQKTRAEKLRSIEDDRSKMLEQHEDFIQMEKIFELMTIRDPSLLDSMLQSGNEVGFVYKTAKEYQDSLLSTGSKSKDIESDSMPAKKKPNLAILSGGGNKTVVETESDLEDVFADLKY